MKTIEIFNKVTFQRLLKTYPKTNIIKRGVINKIVCGVIINGVIIYINN